MAARQIKCPCCGAPVKYNEGALSVKCEYCDSVMEIEQPKEVSDRASAEKTIRIITEYRDAYFRKEKAQKELKSCESRLKIEEHGDRFGLMRTVLLAAFLWGAAIVFFAGLIRENIVGSFLFYLLRFISAYISGAVSIGLSVLIHIFFTKKRSDALYKTREEYKTAKKEYDDSVAAFDENLFDEKYRDEEAFDYMLLKLNTGKAFTLRQAMGKYDEYEENDFEDPDNMGVIAKLVDDVGKGAKIIKESDNFKGVRSAVGGAAAIAGTAIAGKAVKGIIKTLKK